MEVILFNNTNPEVQNLTFCPNLGRITCQQESVSGYSILFTATIERISFLFEVKKYSISISFSFLQISAKLCVQIEIK